jgi:ABC-2 type transport system permease protein
MERANAHGTIYWAISDSMVLVKRSILHILKNTDQLLGVIFMPVMFFLLFRYVFGGAINTGGVSYVDFLFAGILVQMAAFGATTTAIEVSTDLQKGIMDRFRSLPMISSAVLIGHTTADLVRNTISSVIMLAVALLAGFRPSASPIEWVAVFGILLLFTYAFSWLSAIIGLLAKSVEGVQWMTFVFVFPLTFASSAFVPASTMPSWLQPFAENQPVTQTVDSIRALTVGIPLGNHAWYAVAWCVGIIIVCVPLTAYMFRRRASQ